MKQKIVTWLGVISAVASAIAGQVGTLNPKTALYIVLAGSLAAAIGGALAKLVESSVFVTVIGVGVAACGVLAGAGDLIGTGKAAVIAIIGTALTAIGKSLFGWGDNDSPNGGPTAPGGFQWLLTFALLGTALTATACDWGKAERPLVAAGYNFQIGILATAKVTGAVRQFKPGSLSPEKAREFLIALQKTSQVGQSFSQAIDQTIEINPQTKSALLGEADRYLAEVDKTIGVLAPGETEIRSWLLVVRAGASAFKIAIASIEVPTPTAKVKANVANAVKQSERALKTRSRDVNDTVMLIDALGVISADFTADVLAQKGLDAATLRTQRDVKYQAAQSFITEELRK